MVTELVDRETAESHPNKPHIRNIFRTVREITQAMDEIVWTINPKNDTLDNLANYIFQYAQEYFQDTGVSCRLDVPAQLPDRPVSTEARHNLFMAVKEALNNALKHSGRNRGAGWPGRDRWPDDDHHRRQRPRLCQSAGPAGRAMAWTT